MSYEAEKVHHYNRLAQMYLGKTEVETFSQPGEDTGTVFLRNWLFACAAFG